MNDVKSFEQRSEEVFQAEDEPMDTFYIQGNALSTCHMSKTVTTTKSSGDEGDDRSHQIKTNEGDYV